ncbi:MAG: hypothetical protein F8N39_06700 [Clostridiaceae bacterium]|nr:hypothetical protein [Clostridiaceae bacterium]
MFTMCEIFIRMTRPKITVVAFSTALLSGCASSVPPEKILGTWYRDRGDMRQFQDNQKKIFNENGTGKYCFNDYNCYKFTYLLEGNKLTTLIERPYDLGLKNPKTEYEISATDTEIVQENDKGDVSHWLAKPSTEYLAFKPQSKSFMCWIDRVERVGSVVSVYFKQPRMVIVKRADGTGQSITIDPGAAEKSDGPIMTQKFLTVSDGDYFRISNGPEDSCSVEVVSEDDVIGLRAHASFHLPRLPGEDRTEFYQVNR